MSFDTLEAARIALARLRWSRALFIRHLCIEDRIVLAADGFRAQAWGDGWLVWRRV